MTDDELIEWMWAAYTAHATPRPFRPQYAMHFVLAVVREHDGTRAENDRLRLALLGYGKRPDDCLPSADGGACVSHEAYMELRHQVDTLFDAIAHGDEKQRAWLRQAIETHFRVPDCVDVEGEDLLLATREGKA